MTSETPAQLATLVARLRCGECGGTFVADGRQLVCRGCGLTGEITAHEPPVVRIASVPPVSAAFLPPRAARGVRAAIRRRLSPLDTRFRPRIAALAESQLPQLRDAVMSVGPAPRTLDIGGGTGRWRLLLGGIDDYVVLDTIAPPSKLHAPYVQASAGALPFHDEAFDLVLLIEVLEHIADPGAALAEARRVLAPGGRLIASTRQAWRTHGAPTDYYRYTRYGLDHLLSSAGFERAELTALGGTAAVIVATLENSNDWVYKPLIRQALIYPLWLLAGLADRTVFRSSVSGPQPDTTGWVVVARRA